MAARSSILKNTSFMGLSTLASYALLFFSTVYLARKFGPEGFGQINFAQIVGMCLSILPDGLKLAGVRALARKGGADEACVRENFTTLFFTSVTVFCLGCIFVLVAPIDLDFKILLLLTAGGSMIMSVFYVDWIFQGHEHFGVVAKANFIRYVFFVFFVVVSMMISPSVAMIGLATLMSAVIASGYCLFKLRSMGLRLRLVDKPASFALISVNFRENIVLGLTSFRNQVFYAPATFMFGLMGLNAEAGQFSAAFKLAFFIGALGNVYMQTVFPRICNYCVNDRARLNDLVFRSMRLLVYLMVPIGVGAVVVSKLLVTTVFGAEFAAASGLFVVLVWAILIMLASYNFSSVLVGFNKQGTFIRIIIGVFAMNICLSFMMLNLRATIGVASVALLSEVLVLGILAWKCYREYGLGINIDFMLPLTGSLVMAGMIYLFAADNVFYSISAGVVVYSFVLSLRGASFLRDLIDLEPPFVGDQKW